MSTSKAQRHLINATTDKAHRVKLYKVGKRWIAMGLTTAALGIAGFATTASAATTDNATDATDATEQGDSAATANAAAIQQPQVAINTSNTQTTANTSTVTSSSTTNQATTTTSTAQQQPATTQTVDQQTSVATPKTTNLGDANASEIDAAKASAAKDYQATGQAQTITAVSDAIGTNEAGVDLATTKTIQGDPIADVTGQYYYSTENVTSKNIVEHYQNLEPLAGSSVKDYSSNKSNQIPLTESGVPVISMESEMPDMDVSQLKIGGLTAEQTFNELGTASAKTYYRMDGTLYSTNVNVYVGDVRYADGTEADLSNLKFSDSVEAPRTINPNDPEHADLLVDYVADGQNYRTVKTVAVRILDQKPVITAAQGITVTQMATNKSPEEILNASATDPEDGDLPVNEVGQVDLTTPGTYRVTLQATDKNNVTSTVETYVKVISKDAINIPIEYEDADTGNTLHEDEASITDFDTAGGIPTYAVDGYTISSEVINLSSGAGSVVANFADGTLNYYSELNGQGTLNGTRALSSIPDDKLAAMGVNQSPAGTIYLGFAASPSSITEGYDTASAIRDIKFLYTKDAVTPQTKTLMPDPAMVSLQDYYDNRTDTGTGTSTTTTTPQVKTSMPAPVMVTADEYYNNLVPNENGNPTGTSTTGTPVNTGNPTTTNTPTNTSTTTTTGTPTSTSTSTTTTGTPVNTTATTSTTGTPTTTGTTDQSTAVTTTDNNTATNGDPDTNALTSDDSNATGLEADNDTTTGTDANNASATENDTAAATIAPQATQTNDTNNSQAINANKLPQTNETTPKTSSLIGLALLAVSSTLGLVVKKRKQDQLFNPHL